VAWYFDSSALVKLVAEEAESTALKEQIERNGWLPVTSEVVRAELVRAAVRKGAAEAAEARKLAASLHLVPVSTQVLELAAGLPPPEIRTLDAVHLASALVLGDGCEGVVTYDVRMQAAARTAGLVVLAPAGRSDVGDDGQKG
jgi:predicted nucleic acid-binding protein